MICKKCGTENPEDAVYCKKCGKKIDEKNLCPDCGYENADDAVFCNRCGVRLNGEDKPEPNLQTSARAEAATVGRWPWRRIAELCGGIFAMCGIFCVLLCTFLLGLDNMGMALDVSRDSGAVVSERIYYFFGQGYQDVRSILDYLEYYGATTEASLYVPVIFGTVISAGTIVSVLVLSVLTAVRYGLKTAGKSEKDYSRLAIATVLTFVLGSLLLLADNAAYISYRSSSQSATAAVSLNGAGVAGIVCGLVCLAIFLGCRIAQGGKELITKQSIIKFSFTAGALVLLGIIVGLAGKPGIQMPQSSSTTAGTNLFAWGGSLALIAESAGGLEQPVVEYVLSFLGQIMQFALVTLAAIAIISRLRHLTEQNRKSGLALAVPLVAVAVVYLILDILTVKFSVAFLYGDDSSAISIDYACAIVTLVFAVLNLAASIVYKALNRKKKPA